MKLVTLLPADTYIVINKSIITEEDKNNIINLYGPIIGPIALSLYFVFLHDLKLNDIISAEYNHHHLMTIMKSGLEDIKIARKTL
jgi:replication initiation and membrane attachment protein DnaB